MRTSLKCSDLLCGSISFQHGASNNNADNGQCRHGIKGIGIGAKPIANAARGQSTQQGTDTVGGKDNAVVLGVVVGIEEA